MLLVGYPIISTDDHPVISFYDNPVIASRLRKRLNQESQMPTV